MLLATYQPKIPNKKERAESIKILKKHIGYYPAFCFLTDTPQQALVGSILAAPSSSEMLHFVNTDTCDYIDVVDWCLYLKTKDESYIASGLNNSCPIERREYLVKEGLLEEEHLSLDLDAVLSGELKIELSAAMDSKSSEFEEYLGLFNDIYSNLRDHANTFIASAVFEKKGFLENRVRKIAFENYLLGMFAHMANPNCKESGIFVMNMPAYSKQSANITRKIAQFYNDDEDVCYTTPAVFDGIYRTLLFLVWNVYWDENTGRNEKCPCGSGKKFKKCHGH